MPDERLSWRDRVHYNRLWRIHDRGQARWWAWIASLIQETFSV